MVDKQSVLYQEQDGIALVTLNRPRALNALSPDTLQQLSLVFARASTDESVRGVIVTGSGKAFSAGADIKFLARATPMEVRALARLAVTVNSQIEALGKVVVAALNGYALGGGLELAESCMIRLAVEGAVMGHPEVRIGAVAGFGGTTRLPRLVGKGRAAELLLRGRTFLADEALQIGLVQAVVPADRLMAEARAIVAEIAAQSPTAVRLTWEALHRGLNMTLEESAWLGADYFGLVASGEDYRRGTRAFVEKTKPAYTGT